MQTLIQQVCDGATRSLTYPIKMQKLPVQETHCRRQQCRSQAPGIGRRMPRQACTAQGRHAGACGAPVGFWKEQEVRKNCASVGCWGAADTRWCGQQKARARWGEAMCLLSLPRVMLPGGGVQRMGGWGSWAGAEETQLAVYTPGEVAVLTPDREAVLSHLHIYLSSWKAESGEQPGESLPRIPSARLMNKAAESPLGEPSRPFPAWRGQEATLDSRCRKGTGQPALRRGVGLGPGSGRWLCR